MSRDIRSFFPPKQSTKKKAPIILSDDEMIEESPVPDRKKQRTPKDKNKNDKDKSIKKQTPKSKEKKHKENEKLKPVSAIDLFGNAPVKQSKVVEKPNKNNNDQKKMTQEEKFNKTVQDLDDEIDFDLNELDKTVDEALKENPEATITKVPLTPKSNKDKVNVNSNTKKRKAVDLNESVLTDQEKFERRQSNYQSYLNRGEPPNKGQKPLPEGNPKCLAGLCFIKTGVLDSLDSEDMNALIVKHGGRTVKAISRKVNYLVTGDDPGYSKVEKAQSFGIPQITEDDLLDMILTKSGKPAKYKNAAENGNAEHEPEEAPSKKRKIEESPVKIKTEPKKDITPKKEVKEFKPPLRTSPRKSKPEVTIKEEPKTPKMAKMDTNRASTSSTVTKVTKTGTSTASTSSALHKSKEELSEDNKSWTEKYKPANIKEIIGQQDANSNMKKLLTWLSKWDFYHGVGSHKKKLPPRPSPWAKNDDGAFFKSALLSGSPGVGKTTTATLVAKELGYDIVEFNASDTRSKKLLHEEVATLLSSKSLITFVKDGSAPTNKHVLLMDEVDGMSGNQDRGGIQELIALIKNSNVPIICICNDRQHPKIRSLVNHCFDLRFNKIKPETIRGRMMSVCFKEGIQIKPDALMQMIVSTGNDIRQTLNHLAMWSASGKNLSNELIQKETDHSKKDTVLGPWEVVRKVFSADEHKNMRLDEKSKLFYYDYNIAPLFVQENYLQVEPSGKNALKCVALAADSISMGDVIESKIRSTNNWSLMEAQAFNSSVLPGHYMSGKFKGQINFPGWLGKNSKGGKLQRFASELQSHMRLSASTSTEAVNLDYVYSLRDNIINPLIKSGTNGVEESVQVMKNYNLLREDLDSILELSQWSNQKDPMARVESKVKAAFTRAYNKEGPMLPYSIDSVSKKKTTAVKDDIFGDEEEDNVDSDEDKDDIGKDAMIKAKKPVAKGKKVTTEASSSKKPTTKGKTKKTK